MTRKQIERECNRRDCTCDNVWRFGHHHRTCKAWRPRETVTRTYESGFKRSKRR